MSSMAMSADFLAAFARLPSQQQRGVRSLIARFNNNSAASGLNYERINGAKDPNMRSLRIDRDYRAIVLKPARGDVHMLLWADKHDGAYAWATRRRCDVNPESGVVQVYLPRDDGPGEPLPASAEPAGAFADLKDRELMRLGVPRAMLPEVRGIADEDGLESIEERLPAEAHDALYLYLAGDSYEDLVRERETPPTVDVEDFTAALRRSESRMRFAVAADEMELEAMLNAPLARWRVFLHPSQRRLVERDWNGPLRVLGGAGTGKTVVAMHRARYLARTLPKGRILFTTFTRNLAADIEHNLDAICTPEEMRRIEVTNLDSWVTRYLRGRRYRFQLRFGRLAEAWRIALDARPPELNLSDAFYEDEWEQVVQASAIADRQTYFAVSRAGRGTPLHRTQRALVWPVFEEYRAQLAERGVKELDDAYRDATALLCMESSDPVGYAAVIVDEAQDMGAPAFRLLRAIAPPGRNDLFIAGDGRQRIYGRHRVALSRCGIDIRGRSRKLKLNYRTTEQTRRWATALLAGRDIDDLNGGTDDSQGVRSLTRGPQPRIAHFDTREEHDAHLLARIGKLVESGEPLRGACVVARTKAERDAAANALRDGGFECAVLGASATDNEQRGDAVRAATMHRVKGLEFDHVLLASVNADLVPLRARGEAADATAKEHMETEERALLHVAATRARKSLTVLSFGKPSRFVQPLDTQEKTGGQTPMPTELKIAFHRAMEEIHQRAKDEAGYNATVFQRMVAQHGGVKTAKRLINASQTPGGYAALRERGRLDLTMEAMIVGRPEFHPLFTEAELRTCRKRLEEYGYDISARAVVFRRTGTEAPNEPPTRSTRRAVTHESERTDRSEGTPIAQAATALSLCGQDFDWIAEVQPDAGADGRPFEYMPQNGYAKAKEKPLNKHGHGPFCRFSIAGLPAHPGLYAVTVDRCLAYVGIASRSLKQRWGFSGYAEIQPVNCYRGGQSTNCKINHEILLAVREGHVVELWIRRDSNPRPLERLLIRKLDPPWNDQP